ncbi:hypothetical protein LJC52_02810 [Bacteroidales bacterium OttesenSCG-928-A17]|nr:hypothetical protein [Bacteroidales bacterium OttesenSCG-928-A17]
MKSIIYKKSVALFLFLGMYLYSYASDVNPKIRISLNEDAGYVQYYIQYHDNESKGIGDVYGWLHADVYADDTKFLRIDGKSINYFDFPSSKGTIKEISRTRDGYRHLLTVRWTYPLSYSEKEKYVTCKVPSALWERQKASDSYPNVVETFRIKAKPYPQNFTAECKSNNNKNQMIFHWTYVNPGKVDNWTFFLMKKSSSSSKWIPIGSVKAETNAVNNGSFTYDLALEDYDKIWEYAIVVAKSNTVATTPTSDNYYTKRLEKKISIPIINNLQYGYDVSKKTLTLSWQWKNESEISSNYLIFRREEGSSSWQYLGSKQLASSYLVDCSHSFNWNDTYIHKNWEYAISLDIEKKGNTGSPLSGSMAKYTKTIPINIKKPIPQSLSTDFNPINYDLVLNWKYENVEKLEWVYYVFKKEKGKENWEQLPDTIPVETKGELQGTFSSKMNVEDFGKDWVYAVSLSEKNQRPIIATTSGYTDSIRVSIIPPYPKDLTAQIDTLSHKLQMKWNYENPANLNWKYAIYKKKIEAESWKLVCDTIPAKLLESDTIQISLTPRKIDLHSDWLYAVSLIEDKTPQSPPEDNYYTQQTEVKAILPPIPYGKYIMWTVIALVFIGFVAILIMRKIGYRA